jgi:hypothetical protein
MFFNCALKRLCPLKEGQYSGKRYRIWGKDTSRVVDGPTIDFSLTGRGRGFVGEELQRDIPFEGGIADLMNNAHPAFAGFSGIVWWEIVCPITPESAPQYADRVRMRTQVWPMDRAARG